MNQEAGVVDAQAVGQRQSPLPLAAVRTRGKAGQVRVLLASALYYPNIGGVENSLFHLSKVYRESGRTPWILTSTGGDSNTTGRWFEVRRMHGIPVLRYKFSSIALVRMLRAWMAFRILSRKFELDAVVARSPNVALASSMQGKPCVYLVPGITSTQHRPKGRNVLRWLNHFTSVSLQRQALRKVATVAVFSEGMATAVEREVGRRDVHRVRPGVDPTRFHPISADDVEERRKSLGIESGTRVAIGVGRLASQKRFDLALDALARTVEPWHLILVGDGPLRGELEQRANTLGLREKVRFTGRVTNPEWYLQAADVYVLSSDYEPLGQVLIEAMACGLPVAAFDSELPDVRTATNEVVPEQWLFKATRKDAESLRAVMIAATASRIEPASIAKWTLRHYSWEALALDMIRLGSGKREAVYA